MSKDDILFTALEKKRVKEESSLKTEQNVNLSSRKAKK